MSYIILPKVQPVLQDDIPLFFFGGPVRGGGDWQITMFRTIQSLRRTFYAAIPCRWNPEHLMYQYRVEGPVTYDRQMPWEEDLIELAALTRTLGCLVFWLGLESLTDPHPGPEPYGMDTRRELGLIAGIMREMTKRQLHGPRVVIGADPSFYGLSQIQRMFDRSFGNPFPVYTTMEEVAKTAIDIIVWQEFHARQKQIREESARALSTLPVDTGY